MACHWKSKTNHGGCGIARMTTKVAVITSKSPSGKQPQGQQEVCLGALEPTREQHSHQDRLPKRRSVARKEHPITAAGARIRLTEKTRLGPVGLVDAAVKASCAFCNRIMAFQAKAVRSSEDAPGKEPRTKLWDRTKVESSHFECICNSLPANWTRRGLCCSGMSATIACAGLESDQPCLEVLCPQQRLRRLCHLGLFCWAAHFWTKAATFPQCSPMRSAACKDCLVTDVGHMTASAPEKAHVKLWPVDGVSKVFSLQFAMLLWQVMLDQKILLLETNMFIKLLRKVDVSSTVLCLRKTGQEGAPQMRCEDSFISVFHSVCLIKWVEELNEVTFKAVAACGIVQSIVGTLDFLRTLQGWPCVEEIDTASQPKWVVACVECPNVF